jgi:hypothetical protein
MCNSVVGLVFLGLPDCNRGFVFLDVGTSNVSAA